MMERDEDKMGVAARIMCRKDLIRGRFRAEPINLEKIQFKYNSEAVYRGSASGETSLSRKLECNGRGQSLDFT